MVEQLAEHMNNTTPLVSVITPFLNGGDWLRQAVESVLAQTYTNWQLILIDDGSKEEATSIAKGFSNQYPGKIIYTEHPGHINLGCSSSRNQGMKFATGELVALLDSDDVTHWHGGTPLMAPKYSWEFIQIGNCGPPHPDR